MTESEAVTELGVRVDSTVWPELSTAELTGIVRRARRVDREGRLLTDEDWEFTCDMAWAEMVAWERKAAKAASAYNFVADGASMSRAQVGEQCRQMAALARRRVSG